MIKLKSLISESYDDYKGGRWVHYTNTPYLKINPKQFHIDLVGIYLFPEKFKPVEHWLEMTYKFIVEIPNNLKILDLSKTTAKDLIDILNKIGGNKARGYDEYINLINSAGKGDSYYKIPADPFWEFLKNIYGVSYGKWNSDFRKLGYDAIFDDTKSIHSNETQLVVLDPTKLKIIGMETRKGSGYNEILMVMARILNMFKKYKGYTVVEKPKKKSNSSENLSGFIQFSTLPSEEWKNDNYRDISFKIYPYKSENSKNIAPHTIGVYLLSSTPRKSYGVGAKYSMLNNDWSDVDKLEKEIEWVLTNPTKYL